MQLYRDEDYIHSRRFAGSLGKLMERHPDGAPDSLIASVLMMEEADVEPVYQAVVQKLRALMKVDE